MGRSVVQQATGVVDRLAGRAGEKLRVTGKLLKALAGQATLEHLVPLVQRVVAQIEERVLEGNARVANKIETRRTSTPVVYKGETGKTTGYCVPIAAQARDPPGGRRVDGHPGGDPGAREDEQR